MVHHKPQPALLCLMLSQFHLPKHPPCKDILVSLHLFLKLPVIKHCQLRRRRRRGGPHIRHIVRDGHIRLMPHRGDHRRLTLKNGSCHHLFIKCPQIFYGAAASSHDDHVQSHQIQGPDPLHDTVLCLLPLDQGRIQHQLHIGVSPGRNIHDIPDSRPRAGRHHPHGPGVSGNGLLVLRGKHPHLFQLIPQLLKPLKQVANAFTLNLPGIKLVSPVPLIHVHRACDNDLLPFLQLKIETFPLPRKHYRR